MAVKSFIVQAPGLKILIGDMYKLLQNFNDRN
jgi:hypothetical protein